MAVAGGEAAEASASLLCSWSPVALRRGKGEAGEGEGPAGPLAAVVSRLTPTVLSQKCLLIAGGGEHACLIMLSVSTL